MKTVLQFCAFAAVCVINWFFASSIFETGTEFPLDIYEDISLWFCVIIISLLESSSQENDYMRFEIKYTFVIYG